MMPEWRSIAPYPMINLIGKSPKSKSKFLTIFLYLIIFFGTMEKSRKSNDPLSKDMVDQLANPPCLPQIPPLPLRLRLVAVILEWIEKRKEKTYFLINYLADWLH